MKYIFKFLFIAIIIIAVLYSMIMILDYVENWFVKSVLVVILGIIIACFIFTFCARLGDEYDERFDNIIRRRNDKY